MNLPRLALANLLARPLNPLLNIVLLALGLGSITLMLLFSNQLENRLVSNAQGIDLVVGAKGSPLQLVLSSVYHADIPTGNIPASEVGQFRANPLIRTVVPLGLGDNVYGFRIVGTEPAYLSLYGGRLAQGYLWSKPMQVVVGSETAKTLGLTLGARFVGSHGLTGMSDLHKQFPYTVVGILAPSGTVLDKLVLTSIESVWAVHAHPDADEMQMAGSAKREPEVTALLIQYRSPMAAVMLPRAINAETRLQAASPAFESNRLLSIAGFGLKAFRMLGLLMIAGAGLSVFVALYNTLNERRRSMAVMRLLGGRPDQLFVTVLLEGLALSVVGIVAGLLLGHLTVYAMGAWLLPAGNQLVLSGAVWFAGEGWVIGLGLLVGVVSAALPAMSASRTDIAKVLAEP
ncbi:ABC transporter permease [Leeia oryzae]|uniref:ABC transporter permease n=1 Tax=Leeia oryzae TaxID=356662 RepID=UPI00036D1534|nr:ABC transporter permease [Leeia oryzae]